MAASMDSGTIDRAAEWLAAARLDGRSVAELPAALRPKTAAEGYDVQQRAAEILVARGLGPVIGWKVGATTAAMQKLLNLTEPAAGTIHARREFPAPARLRHSDFRKPGIECEVCVRLKSPLPGGPGKVDRAAVAAAVGSLRPAIEVVDNRYGDFVATGTPTIIADAVFHAAIVLGAEVADWQRLDLAACKGTATVNGQVKLSGTGAEVLGHPFESVAWLANLLAGRGQRLEAGQYVMTGSITLPYWANPGETVTIAIEGLGSVTATLA